MQDVSKQPISLHTQDKMRPFVIEQRFKGEIFSKWLLYQTPGCRGWLFGIGSKRNSQ